MGDGRSALLPDGRRAVAAIYAVSVVAVAFFLSVFSVSAARPVKESTVPVSVPQSDLKRRTRIKPPSLIPSVAAD